MHMLTLKHSHNVIEVFKPLQPVMHWNGVEGRKRQKSGGHFVYGTYLTCYTCFLGKGGILTAAQSRHRREG